MDAKLNGTDSDFVVEPVVGRLLRTCIGEVISTHQVTQIKSAVIGAMQHAGEQVVVCTDWRSIRVFAPEIADALISMFAVTNRRVLRGGILLAPENATLTLQLERVLQTSHNVARRAFRDPEFMLRWLGEVLTPTELECAKDFIHGKRD